ncbi:MAG: amidohydrolase [Planctomycetes bacterium]|nr:amidohydrolase [Planctomycetota bacterium]
MGIEIRRKIRSLAVSALILLTLIVVPEVNAADVRDKEATSAAIDRRKSELIKMSDAIWGFAETALRETKSSKVLADYAEQQGFKVTRGVAGMPTAFTAEFGSGKPIISILGEFDALPGLSQKAVPLRDIATPGAPGHGCGHNMFGSASLGAATAIKELIAGGKLKGTIRFYGTPAEEAVGGKIYMLRDGLFKDVDICLAWHPSDKIQSDMVSTQALVDFIVEYKGKAAHAAYDPWNGRSAVDGLELTTHGINMLREHVKPTVRMHYVIQSGGQVPNVVPEYAKLWCWVRDANREGMDEVFQRVKKIAEGGAMMAGVESKTTVQSGDYERLVNNSGQKLLQANLQWLGSIEYTPNEVEFAKKIQSATGVPEKGLNGVPRPLEGQEFTGGSTDVGDVSWVVPTIHLSVTTAPIATPWHSWPVVACGGMSIGHKGMVYAAKALAATMVDLFEDSAACDAMTKEFKEQTAGKTYKGYIPDGPPPIPKD